MRFLIPLLLLSVAVLALPGCAAKRFLPATVGDVDAVREDNLKAAESQRDAFRDHLVAKPGDVEGAVGDAFATNVSAHEQANASSGDSIGIEELVLLLLGGGATGTAFTRLIRGPATKKVAPAPAKTAAV